ncbi:phospholipase D-like protein [Knoellia remsis]|uniref:Phospholipase D-like protein n=1 Tax=Knoellia remsis TaxID=407159 RepID=A0A2T0UN30_9MICO|nr:PLD nuclease N-terminal domain-containing protein [Knoellia remsis]PRY59339.1 phospholipase D-like protein [Knoellia remsis]
MLRYLPVLLGLALTIYCVVDCVQSDEHRVRGLPKLVWVFVILLFPFAGAIAWLIAGRPKPVPPAPRRPMPRGPDDDPDFLRGL